MNILEWEWVWKSTLYLLWKILIKIIVNDPVVEHDYIISEIKAVQKAHSNSRWRHTFSCSISMQSALDMFMSMRYTNLRFIIIIIIIIISSFNLISHIYVIICYQ